jgi:hypothetical protein
MSTEDLTKRLRLIEALLRERQYEFALALATTLDDALAKLPPDFARCVPNSIRDQVQSLRSEAQAGVQLA